MPLKLMHSPGACVVTDRSGQVLRAFPDNQGIWRYPVEIEAVSPLYIEALLAYEDRFFYRHPGVNPLAMIRAFFQYIGYGKIISGGSTLSMQTVRLLCPDIINYQGSRVGKKMLQILRALQLETKFSKKEILNLYLTHAPFGSNIQGVQAAAMTYLGKSCNNLSHAEAALLAVLPQAPSFLRPDKHPQRAKKARDKVLARMNAFKIWSESQIKDALMEPVLPLRFSSGFSAPLAARRLYKSLAGKAVIKTTIDAQLQAHAEEIILSYSRALSRNQSCAVLVVDNTNMNTIIYIGSGDFFNNPGRGQVDMVTALRSPGSTLKPFLYGIGLDMGLIHSHSLLLDTPRAGQEYTPENFTKGFSGPVTVENALRDSLNLPAVQVLSVMGPQLFHDRLKNAGARLSFPGRPNLSLILGGAGTDLASLVTLYTGLARKGVCAKPRMTEETPLEEAYLMSPGAAYIVSRMLTRPMPLQQGLEKITGTRFPAWKTGTSFGFRDAWAVGIQGKYTAGVWVGRPDGSPSPGQYGAVTALPLLARILESLPNKNNKPIPRPESVSRQTICWPLGMDVQRSLGACHVSHKAWILNNQIPATLPHDINHPQILQPSFWINGKGELASPGCNAVKKITIALWPRQAETWIPIKWRAINLIPKVSSDCPDISFPVKNPIKIIGISREAILTLPPGQKKRPFVPLKAEGGQGRLHWFLNRVPLKLEFCQNNHFPMPEPGRYDLSVIDENGSVDIITFRVIGEHDS